MSFESLSNTLNQAFIHAKLVSLSNKIATFHEVEEISINRTTFSFRDMDIEPYALDEIHKHETDINQSRKLFTEIVNTVFGPLAQNVSITHDDPNWFFISYNFPGNHKRTIQRFRTKMKVKKR